jgi:hypothetical protein
MIKIISPISLHRGQSVLAPSDDDQATQLQAFMFNRTHGIISSFRLHLHLTVDCWIHVVKIYSLSTPYYAHSEYGNAIAVDIPKR